MKGMITVADAARTDSRGSKVSALGAFWSNLRDGNRDMDVLFVLRFEQDELGVHALRITLAPVGHESLGQLADLEAELNVSPREDAAMTPGLPAVISNAIRVSGTELEHGLYAWRLFVDGELLDEWLFRVFASDKPGDA